MSTLLEQASLVLIPSGYKEDIVYSQIPTSGAGDLSFIRVSNGTRVNSAGLVEVCPWNLVQQSNTFNTTWTSGGPGGTATSGQADPNGGTNAWLLTKLGQTGRIEQTINVGGVQTFFMYAKKNTSDFILINIYDGTTSHECWFNLSTGVVGTQNSATGSIESVGNGWYKCLVTSTNAYASGIIQIYQSDNNGVVTGTSGSIYIFNSQLNIGSTAKPYFPTTDRLNVPRLTYQNGGGGCPSLLLEKQSTNLVTYSEQFNNAAWSTAGSTVAANNTTSPDGTQNADLLTLNTTSYASIYQAVTTTNGATYTASIYAKKGNQNFLGLEIRGSSSATDTVFNLNTGVVVSGTGTIENVGNGWYRCSITKAANSTSTLLIIGRGDSGGTNDTLYLWGAQLEASSYPTSYIPTTSSSATRVADACFKTGISSLIGQAEGVFYAEFTMPETQSPSFFSISDGTTSNRILFGYYLGALRYYADSATGAFAVGGVIDASPVVGQVYKIALAYKSNDFVVYKNGTNTNTLTTFTVPASLTQMDNAAGNAGQNIYASVKEILLFKTRLTNAELASLTTI